MSRIIRRAALALLVAIALVPFTLSTALAHGHTTVGDYTLVIGFHNEPAYQGEPNGLDLFVSNTNTKENINGLADSLKAEIIFGASKKELKIKPQFGRDGAYTAYVLPSEKGDYTWHIWGDIKGTPVDISMTSSPTTFGAVEAKSAVAFPAAEATPAELQAQAAAAAQSAQLALIVGIVGAVLGVVGTVFGVIGLRARSTAAASATGQPQRAA
jgi:hypothetical protein